MTKYEFVKRFLPEAEAAEKRFHLNPVVMLAQAAIESGWNESNLVKLHRNLFGITGYGPSNEFWHGCRVELVPRGLPFRNTNRYFTDIILRFKKLLNLFYSLL